MKFLTIVAALALCSTSVLAAQVGDVHGKVLINVGKGFVPVANGAVLKAGDELMVGSESFATLAFAGCTVSLSKPTVFVVADKAPCASGNQAAADAGVFISPTADAYVVPTVAYWPWALGGAAVIGVVVVTTGILDNKDDPVSAELPGN